MSGGRTSAAGAAQARRLAAHREALLATGAHAVAELAELRREDVETTRAWLAARLGDRALFTVTHGRGELVPAFQLTAAGEPRPELQPLLEVLLGADVRGFALWTWLSSPSAYLSGGVPSEVAASDPYRALHGAERFAWAQPGG